MTIVAGRKCRRCRKPAWQFYATPGVSFMPALPETVCGCGRAMPTSWSCKCGGRGSEGHPLNALFAFVAHRRTCALVVARVVSA